MNDWTSYGRIDADGTVYVKTAEGERVVGSWQAGPPEEGSAHFARRFADLVTEVDLIESRLASGVADPSQALASVRRLRDSLAARTWWATWTGSPPGWTSSTGRRREGGRGPRRPGGGPGPGHRA